MGDTDDESDERGENRRESEVAIDGGYAALRSFGFGGGFPLQQALPGDHAADHGANDGVDGHHGLVREKRESEQGGEKSLLESDENILSGTFLLDEKRSADAEDELDKDRDEEDEEGEQGPGDGAARQAKPSGDEQDHGGGLDQRAAEMVEDLPAGDGRDG